MRYLNTRLYSSVIAGVIAFLMIFCCEAKAENSSKIVKLSMNKTVWNTLVNKNINPFRSNTATWDKAGKNQIKPEEFLKMKNGTIFFINMSTSINSSISTVKTNSKPTPTSPFSNNNTEAVEALNEKAKKLDEALTQEKAKNSQLEAQVKKLTVDQKANDLNKLNNELSKKQEEVNVLNQKVAELEAKNTKTSTEKTAELNALKEQHKQENQKKDEELNVLKEKNSELETSANQKISSLEAENAKLKSGINLSSIWATNWFLTLLIPFVIFTMGFLLCYFIIGIKSENKPTVKNQPIPANKIQAAPNSNNESWLKRLTSKEAFNKLKAEGIDGYMAHIRGFQEYIP